MINQALAKLLHRVAHAYSFLGVEWKPRAYERAASTIERTSDDVRAIIDEKGTEGVAQLPGIGSSIADHIREYVENGHVEEFDELFEQVPDDLDELLEISGLGPARVRELHDELGVETVDDLRERISQGKVAELEGFGEKSESRIETALETPKSERVPIGEALPQAEDLVAYLQETTGARVDYAGSLRRMRATIGDIDLLASTDDAEGFMDAVVAHPDVERVVERGETLTRIVLSSGLDVDVRVVSGKSYGAALMYFTGSRQHNINLRTLARKQGYSLSEYGLKGLDDEQLIETPDEKDVYDALGLEYVPPELREDRGEIDAAGSGIPELIEETDLRGDLHMHSTFSDGQSSIEDMARAGKERGYDYIAITDHSPSSGRGLGVDRIDEQHEEIDRVQHEVDIRIFKGTEVDILEDGSLDYDDETLERFELVIASPHRYLDQDEETYTKRLIRAIEHPSVRIIGHPTGRRLDGREGARFDVERVARAAANSDVALEINSSPMRLDLDDEHVLGANGCLFSIDTDSHMASGLGVVRYGIGMARRGWLGPERVLTTKTLEELENWLDRQG